MNTPFYLSKRFYLNLAAIVALVVPSSNAFIQAHLTESGSIWATLNIILGFISKGKISLS